MRRKYVVAVTLMAFVLMAFAGIVQAKPGEVPPGKAKHGMIDVKQPKTEANWSQDHQDKADKPNLKSKASVVSTVYGSIDAKQNLKNKVTVVSTVYGSVYANQNKAVKTWEGLMALLKATGKTISTTATVKGKKVRKTVKAQIEAWIQLARTAGLLLEKEKANPNQPMKLKDLKKYLTRMNSSAAIPSPTVAQAVYEKNPDHPIRIQNDNSPVTWAQFNAVLEQIKKK